MPETTETKTAHTPGPWIVGSIKKPDSTVPDALAVWPVADMHGSPICLVGTIGHVTERDEANAFLIASAPDLLEACKGVMRLAGELDKAGLINDPAINAVRDAIAKAQGE